MDIQVRISLETANLFEEIKAIYQEATGINYTKSDVLMKAIKDHNTEWETVDWTALNVAKFDLREYDIPQGALRPKLVISHETAAMLTKFQEDVTKVFYVRKLGIGVCMKLILKFAFSHYQFERTPEPRAVIEKLAEDYMKRYNSDEAEAEAARLAIQAFAEELITRFEAAEPALGFEF